MFYKTKQDLIEVGLLNRLGLEDEIIGYANEPCVNCKRSRVEQYKSGMLVCEKCDTDQSTGLVVDDRYYQNNI